MEKTLTTLATKVASRYEIASIVGVSRFDRAVIFRSAHPEPIAKISVMAHKDGLNYEIGRANDGLLKITITPKQKPVSAKHPLDAFHGIIRDTDA